MTEKGSKRHWTSVVVLINSMVILGIVATFLVYNSDYKKKLHNQNLNDIVNINQSTANIVSAFFSTRHTKLNDITKYAEKQNMTVDGLMEYIYSSTTMDNCTYQVLDDSFKGYVADVKDKDSKFVEIDYSNYGYNNLQKVLADNEENEEFVTPEFTDAYSGFKSFALFKHINIVNSSGEKEIWTILSVAKSKYFQEYIDLDGGFDDFYTVITDKYGNYILGNPYFKSTNLYEYLAQYNDFTLDKRNEVKKEVTTKKKGNIKYKNSLDKNCVYVYTIVPQTEWFSVSCVPLSSFHSNNQDMHFTIVIAVLLLILMAVDLLWLRTINKRLKISAMKAETANAAKTDFLSRMSHDIRTPLNVINGMTILALQEDDEKEKREYLKNINSSGKFLTGLVNDILDLNKVESGKMELHKESYSYHEFKRYIEAVITPLCKEKNIEFKILCDVNDITLNLDSLRFNQIFFNLLSNAVKFTQKGGIIVFEAGIEYLSKEHVKMNIRVEDNGCGMSKEFQYHMFEAFSQENGSHTGEVTGTGLGLAIVNNLVNLMGGTIRVKSELGEGTAFYIQMESEIVNPKNNEEKVIVDDKVLEGKRILLCEDHPLNRQIAVKLLSKKNVSVETAEDGKIGCEKFENSEIGYYSAILMDIRMPVMDGLEAARYIRATARSDAKIIPIIAMTANAYDIDVQNSLNAGMNAHLAKPVEPDKLYAVLAEVMKEDL